jgi:Chaperone of endosialidase
MGSSPKPPDPYATAAAQTNANMLSGQANAILGNVNEVNPYGSVAYNKLGYETVYDSQGRANYVPRYERNVQLSPDQMRLFGLETQGKYNLGLTAVEQSAKIRDLLNKSVNTEGLQAWNAGPGAGDIRQDQGPTDRAAIEQAMMASYKRANDPREQAQQVQMSLRGMSPGSMGYSTMQQGQEDAHGEAARQAYLASGGESRAAQDAYNQATLQRGTLADRQNALRQAQLSERLALRNQPINEIMALMGGSSVSMPQFQAYNAPQIAAAPVGQYIYDNYRARAQNAQAQNQGLFGIAGSALGALGSAAGAGGILPMLAMSDRRMKTAIEPTGARLAGLPLYRFRFRHDPSALQLGVMADEVRRVMPEAVRNVTGHDMVDYGLLIRRHHDGF